MPERESEMLNKLSLVFNTVRYMTPRQWRYRLYYMVRNRFRSGTPKEAPKNLKAKKVPTVYDGNISNPSAVLVADEIMKGNFPTVAGEVRDLSEGWSLPNEPYRLICFRLNSFRWLLELSDAYQETGSEKYIQKGYELIQDWHEKMGGKIHGDAWNPYVIAERITNWIGFASKYFRDEYMQEVACIVYPQAMELKESIEYQLGANHLLSEAKALVLAGMFLQNTDLYKTGKYLLLDEAREQFLPDGGHYERSVSYHVEALQQYFEAFVAMRSRNDSDASRIHYFMYEPYRFLNSMIRVNSTIPLFNDAAYDYPFYNAVDFLATANYLFADPAPNGKAGNYAKRWAWIGHEYIEMLWYDTPSSYYTGILHHKFEAGGEEYSFNMDCGDNGPEYNQGHAHADALSILLCSKYKDIIVDTGVFTYQPGEDRDYCRSTSAHNTVEINDKNSAEVWGAFRTARRGHTKFENKSNKHCYHIRAWHDGYVKCLKSPVMHTRDVNIRDGRIVIKDTVDAVVPAKAISRFHLSPNCSVEMESPHELLIDGHIRLKTDGYANLADCMVAAWFGEAKSTKCIEIDFCGMREIETKFIFE